MSLTTENTGASQTAIRIVETIGDLDGLRPAFDACDARDNGGFNSSAFKAAIARRIDAELSIRNQQSERGEKGAQVHGLNSFIEQSSGTLLGDILADCRAEIISAFYSDHGFISNCQFNTQTRERIGTIVDLDSTMAERKSELLQLNADIARGRENLANIESARDDLREQLRAI